jgi:hypothetical protein
MIRKHTLSRSLMIDFVFSVLYLVLSIRNIMIIDYS